MHHYIPLSDTEREEMLAAIGVSSIEELFSVIPAEIREQCEIPDHRGLSEMELRRFYQALGSENQAAHKAPCFMGGGAYQHYIPATVGAIISRGDFFSAYTPYQPEVSQGTLHAIYEFQSLVAAVIGMPVVNASMYDGASSTAEALLMAQRVTGRNKVLIAETLHPHYREVIETYTQFWNLTKETVPFTEAGTIDTAKVLADIDEETAAVVVQTPNFLGLIEDLKPIVRACQEKGVMVIGVGTEPMAYGVYASPGEQGVDIFAGEGQSLGIPLSFGGPYVGLFGARKKHTRQMPGRLCGKTFDERGKPGFVLTLSTREQHIRREKATSNICTNQGLCALAVAVYLSVVGKGGFTEIAKRNVQTAYYLKDRLAELPGYRIPFEGATFNEFVVELPMPVNEWRNLLGERGYVAGIDLHRSFPERFNDRTTLMCATEMHDKATIDGFIKTLQELPTPAEV